MKAAIFESAGAPEVFRIVEVPDPRPASGEVLIRVDAISLEGGDLGGRREGKAVAPAILGYAAAGTILELGHGVRDFQVGQRVTTFASAGSHAERRVVPAATTFAVPDGLDPGVEAAIPCGPGTAALALDLGGVRAGDSVLVIGATGGVGNAAVQIAAAKGARVIGVSRSAESLDRLRPLGLSDGVVSGSGPLVDQVRTLTDGRGADLLIDTVGGEALTQGLLSLAEGGRAVMIGVIGGFGTPIDSGILFMRRLTVTGCLLGPVIGDPHPRFLIEALLRDAADGRFVVPIEARFPLSEMAAAHRAAEEVGKLGRVIVVPDR